ncbi:hypothetical protein LWE61_11020 [Sphingobium sufflavum]|uniref:hypothetical protein n=1 Tax=Sphingobium sufflavum TaxID=1129547 RepID=UPI001F27BE0E|nr:hypothetical protein [Sphingobium sufflavum]MCE7797089.1 hypothetical protein [Sphingobium sufflavum]
METPRRYVVDIANLQTWFPTHRHTAEFWEVLGRAVGTFGFLEETLGKAIFSFTATRSYSEEEIGTAYEKWLPTLERALSDQLGSLIDAYAKAVRDHEASTLEKGLNGAISPLSGLRVRYDLEGVVRAAIHFGAGVISKSKRGQYVVLGKPDGAVVDHVMDGMAVEPEIF